MTCPMLPRATCTASEERVVPARTEKRFPLFARKSSRNCAEYRNYSAARYRLKWSKDLMRPLNQGKAIAEPNALLTRIIGTLRRKNMSTAIVPPRKKKNTNRTGNGPRKEPATRHHRPRVSGLLNGSPAAHHKKRPGKINSGHAVGTAAINRRTIRINAIRNFLLKHRICRIFQFELHLRDIDDAEHLIAFI